MHKVRRVVVPLIWFFAVVDLVLFLGVVHREWFSSLLIRDFLWVVWDAISLWSGRAITIAGVLVPILVYLFKKRWPMERTWKETVTSLSGKFSVWCERAWIVFPIFGILLVAAVVLTYVLCTKHPQFTASASAVLITPDGSELYVITQDSQKSGKVVRFDATTGKEKLGVIDVGGTPDRMLAGPRSGYVYVLDVQNARVTVLNPNHSIREVIQSRGKISTSMVITPDERKLYISNQQPSPHATITVIDLVKKEHPAHPIDGFNCPMGLGILPDGSKLYVATQCGSGHDPVFVVDTRTDKIVHSIQDFAVGGEVAVAGTNLRVYVSRSNFFRLDRMNKNRIEEPARISAIDPARDESVNAETINDGGSALTVSPDGQYFFFSTSTSIEILNTETQKRSSIGVGSAATGIAVGRPDLSSSSLVLYAWLPEQNRIFFTGLDGLLP
ncbi:MAG: YncE family protein [Gallionella sp.]|nr:YncE family protein [Gallionella sp.]